MAPMASKIFIPRDSDIRLALRRRLEALHPDALVLDELAMKHGDFRVDLPAPENENVPEFAQLDTIADFQIEGAILPLQGEQYGVMWGEIDPDIREREQDDEELLATTIEEILDNNPGIRKLREKPITVSGKPGDDALHYQERADRLAIEDSRR